MSKGRSFVHERWDQFQTEKYSFMEDDFVHKENFMLRAKINAKKQKTGATLKQIISQKAEGVNASGIMTFWLPLNKRLSIFSKIQSHSKIFFQLDHDNERKFNKASLNPYCGFIGNRSFYEKIGFVGLDVFNDEDQQAKWSINNRFLCEFNSQNLQYGIKGYYRHKNIFVNGLATLFYSPTSEKKYLDKLGLLLGWIPSQTQQKKQHYFLRYERKSNFSKESYNYNMSFDFLKDLSNGHMFCYQTSLHGNNLTTWNNLLASNNIGMALAYQFKDNKKLIKAKVNRDLKLAITIKKRLKEYLDVDGYYGLGVQASELGTKNRFKFGMELFINV